MKLNPINKVEVAGIVVQIRRTARRKSATIKVNADQVMAIVPQHLADAHIIQLVKNKQAWISEKIQLHHTQQAAQQQENKKKDTFKYLGRNYHWEVLQGEHTEVKLSQGCFKISLPTACPDKVDIIEIQSVLSSWYQQRAKIQLEKTAKHYASQLGVSYQSINVKSYKSRWGSCSSCGEISFNWVLILAPRRVLDYVVIHELCHLVHHNHSPKFWQLVAQIMPDFAECKTWLKVNGHQLDI